MVLTFDALGRTTSSSNVLGLFTNFYVGATMRLSSVSYPNGQGTAFSYFDTNHDVRLQTISNTNASGGIISKFDYAYDADGQIQTWTKQSDTTSTNTFTFQYDPTDQLLGAVLAQTSLPANVIHQYLYSYDKSGNRTGEQVDTAPVGASFNTLNQLTNQVSNGMVQFGGNITKTGVVSVAGNSAVMTNQTNFSANVVTQNGTNPVQIKAFDLNGNSAVSNYQLIVTNNSVSRTLTYDQNGNLTTNSTSAGTTTYEWDAANRLTAINEAGTNRSEFTYDGVGRRVRIVERNPISNLILSTEAFVWCGTELWEERDSSGTSVTKRFFGQGEQISGTNYYFTYDHLGSVREMTDTARTIHARYDYDPYGRLTKVSGDMDANFGFTGHYNHAISGLSLTLYRAYDPNTGRWISRDPMQEGAGINVYLYAGNDPICRVDRDGRVAVVLAIVGVVVLAGMLALLGYAIKNAAEAAPNGEKNREAEGDNASSQNQDATPTQNSHAVANAIANSSDDFYTMATGPGTLAGGPASLWPDNWGDGTFGLIWNALQPDSTGTPTIVAPFVPDSPEPDNPLPLPLLFPYLPICPI